MGTGQGKGQDSRPQEVRMELGYGKGGRGVRVGIGGGVEAVWRDGGSRRKSPTLWTSRFNG